MMKGFFYFFTYFLTCTVLEAYEINVTDDHHFTSPLINNKDEEIPENFLNQSGKVSTATFLSIIPGAGEFYLGNYEKAFTYIFPYTLTIAAVINEDTASSAVFGQVSFDLHMFSVFDSYRDARLSLKNGGYRFPISKKSFSDLMKTPFSSENIFSGYNIFVVGESVITLSAYYLLSRDGTKKIDETPEQKLNFSEKVGVSALLGLLGYLFFIPVAVSEEGFFRGFLQGSLNESMNNNLSLIFTSAVFGLIHIPQVLTDTEAVRDQAGLLNELKYMVPFRFLTAFSGGLLFGAIYNSETGSLDKSIVAHTLSNTIVVMVSPFMANKIPFNFSYSFKF